jgi:hypothetical protein
VELPAQNVKSFPDRRPDGALKVADVVPLDGPRGRVV